MSSSEQQLSGPDFTRGVPASDISDGGMLLGHVNGEAVLLAKRFSSAGAAFGPKAVNAFHA